MACYLGSFVFSPSLFLLLFIGKMFQFYKNCAENVQKLGDLDKRKARKGVDVSALQYLSIGCCVMEKVANGEYLENIVKNILFKISKYLHLFSLKLNMKNDQFENFNNKFFL